MRWFIRSLIMLTLAWAIFAVSPYVALYSFAKALEARDVDAITERVNFHAVRISITKQIVTAYLNATGRSEELKGTAGRFAVGAATNFADPLVEEYVTPEALIGLLQGNNPGAAPGRPVSLPAGGPDLASLRSLDEAWDLFMHAETRGFRAISFALPPNKAADEQFRLQFRLSGTTWRVVGLEMPKSVEGRLVQELMRRNPTAS
jgi:hypothetical protein